jgi:hypothetical protein
LVLVFLLSLFMSRMQRTNDAGASVLIRSDNAASHQFDKHLANAAYAATASQSGEMQGLR